MANTIALKDSRVTWEMRNGILNDQRVGRNMEDIQRRIQMYCKEARINGTVLEGNTWLIPKDAEKPQDPRKHNADN